VGAQGASVVVVPGQQDAGNIKRVIYQTVISLAYPWLTHNEALSLPNNWVDNVSLEESADL
jgi:hypothetical protein